MGKTTGAIPQVFTYQVKNSYKNTKKYFWGQQKKYHECSGPNEI